MTPSSEFITGLKILEPFLFQYGFELDNMKTQQSSGGQFTNAEFINGKKKFIIGYRYSVGLLDYQYENSVVMHNFYLDGLGYADKKQYPDFQTEDLQGSFRHILADFEYLKDDFFIGQCTQLKKIAILQIKHYEELQAKLNAEDELKRNKKIIDEARQQFKMKNYTACIDIYKTVSKNYVLTEFDKKTLQRCNDHLRK
jgi:hypothetical protein